jgi:hypothetical protein
LTAVFSFASGSACKVVVRPRLAALVQIVKREVRARDGDFYRSAQLTASTVRSGRNEHSAADLLAFAQAF